MIRVPFRGATGTVGELPPGCPSCSTTAGTATGALTAPFALIVGGFLGFVGTSLLMSGEVEKNKRELERRKARRR
jgi:amino acid transporter